MEPPDIERIGPQLRKIKISQLNPELLDGVLELAVEHGFELTFTSSSDLSFLFKIYQAEKARDKKQQKLLRKAEKLINRLAGLYFSEEGRQREHKKAEDKKQKPRFDILESELAISLRMQELFSTVGISDEKEMRQTIALLGEKKVEERIGLALKSKLGEDLVRKVFSENPETLRIVKDEYFVEELSAMENKKDMIDAWMATNKGPPPVWADYNQSPNILLVEYKNIYRALGMEGKGGLDAGPEKGEHFMKMFRELGLSVQQRGEDLVIRGPDGRSITIPASETRGDPYEQALKKAGTWHVGGEEVSAGELVSTGRILRTIESVILNHASLGIESDIIVITGDKRKLNQINQLFGRDTGDHALAAYRKIFGMAVNEAAGGGIPYLIRPSQSGDEAIGIIVVPKDRGASVRAKLADCLELATRKVLSEIGEGHPLGDAMRKLRRPRDAVEAVIDVSEPVLVRRSGDGAVAIHPDGRDAMISRPDGRREFLAAQVRTTDEMGSARHARALRERLNTPTSPQIEGRTEMIEPEERVNGVAFELKMNVTDPEVLRDMQAILPQTGKGLYEVAKNSFGIRGLNTFLGHYGANGLIQQVENAVAEHAKESGLSIRRVGTLKYVIDEGTPGQAARLREFVGASLAGQGILLGVSSNPKEVRGMTPAQIEGAIANGHLGLDWRGEDHSNANAAISAMALANDQALSGVFRGEMMQVTAFIRAHPEVRNVLDLFTALRSADISGPGGPIMEKAFSDFVMTLRGAPAMAF